MIAKMYLYSIALTNGKYYIGSSNNLHVTFKHIFSNKEKNRWLNTYKPLYVHRIVDNDIDKDLEHDFLKEYINRYGIDNVYGSTFDSTIIEEMAYTNALKNINNV